MVWGEHKWFGEGTTGVDALDLLKENLALGLLWLLECRSTEDPSMNPLHGLPVARSSDLLLGEFWQNVGVRTASQNLGQWGICRGSSLDLAM